MIVKSLVMRGMKTDLASVPRIAWDFVIAPWDCGRGFTVIHDHLYAVLRKYYHSKDKNKSTWRKRIRKLSDEIFLLGMKSVMTQRFLSLKCILRIGQ